MLKETQRLSNLLPLNLTRVANKDVKIGGHNLKAGTVVIPQISTVLFDERVFLNIFGLKNNYFKDIS